MGLNYVLDFYWGYWVWANLCFRCLMLMLYGTVIYYLGRIKGADICYSYCYCSCCCCCCLMEEMLGCEEAMNCGFSLVYLSRDFSVLVNND
jgi:hypothetical protein